MSSAQLLLKAYYELLYERMQTNRDRLLRRIDELLPAEIDKRSPGGVSADRRAAYREAALAFVDERAESYNPIGIQYTFDRVGSQEVAELEFQLNWYDSRAEFERLIATAQALVPPHLTDEMLPVLADALVGRAGAFPDQSIIAAYRASPTLQKLPDYAVACSIEVVVCGRRP